MNCYGKCVGITIGISNRCDICPQGVYIDKIRINHYWTRDENFFWNIKVPRNDSWGGNHQTMMDLYNDMNAEYDPILSSQRE